MNCIHVNIVFLWLLHTSSGLVMRLLACFVFGWGLFCFGGAYTKCTSEMYLENPKKMVNRAVSGFLLRELFKSVFQQQFKILGLESTCDNMLLVLKFRWTQSLSSYSLCLASGKWTVEIVVPVVMEMFKWVHEKFTLHYSLILPPVGEKNATTPNAYISLINIVGAFFKIHFKNDTSVY